MSSPSNPALATSPLIPGVPAIGSGAGQLVPVPSQLYIGTDDQIAVFAVSAQNNEVVTYSGRFLRRDGVIIPFQQQFKMPSGFNETTSTLQLGEGWLLGFTITSSLAKCWGQTYARAILFRGKFTPNPIVGTSQVLCAGYVYANSPCGWPGFQLRDPTDGVFVPTANALSTPAAGADIFNSGAQRDVPVLLIASLATSAAVANRNVNFGWGNGAGTLGGPGAPASQTASTTKTYGFAMGVPQYTDAQGIIWIPIPERVTLSGAANIGRGWGTSTQGLQAGDQWTHIKSEVLRLLEML